MVDKAVVLLSGGQDSITSLFWAKQCCEEVHAISLFYGQRHKLELEAAAQVAKLAECASYEVIDVASAIGNFSALVDSTKEIQLAGGFSDAQMPEGLPTSYVPGRNLVFLTVAAIRASVIGAHTVVTGVCQTDYSGYPDCRRPFIDALEMTIAQGFPSGVLPINIKTPLMHLTKAQTVHLAKELGDKCWEALGLSVTCYYGKRPGCGVCPSCTLRAKGFEEAGYADPAH